MNKQTAQHVPTPKISGMYPLRYYFRDRLLKHYSNYWTAAMYFRHTNGSYKRVPQYPNAQLGYEGCDPKIPLNWQNFLTCH